MYSFKEKQKYFSELQNPAVAVLDLKLLVQKNPLHPHLSKFSRNPQRYSNEILYQLLDVAKRDEIRNNRRPPVSQKAQPKSNKANASNSQNEENGKLPTVEAEKVGNENTTQEPPASTTPVPEPQDKISDVTNQIVEAEERAEEAEERAEEAEERAEELELRVEEAEERADNAEIALEEEKKKVVTTPKPKAEKSKNTKSTQKLTGTTSPTRKSRQPRSSTTTGS